MDGCPLSLKTNFQNWEITWVKMGNIIGNKSVLFIDSKRLLLSCAI